MILDDWQKQYLEIKKGNTLILGGRQIGKSEIESDAEAEYLATTPKAHLLIVSGVERQASSLYNKILEKLERNYPKLIVKYGKERPLKTVFKLKNGAVCRTEPIGVSGEGARRHTLTRIVFEEMQLIPEDAFAAITPMLLTTGGDIRMLGTALKTDGYVWERLSDPNFKVFRIDAEDVAEKRPEPQRTIMLNWLSQERKRLTEAQYAQEYKAIPQNKLRMVFDENLIKMTCVLQRQEVQLSMKCYGGSDISAMGDDLTTFEIFDGSNKENIVQIQHISTKKEYPHQTAERIIKLDLTYNFKEYGIDDGGVGVGVLGLLLKDSKMGQKVVALNNARRSLDREDKNKKSLLKEDMYLNLLTYMQSGKIKLLSDLDIIESLRSCQYELDGERINIFGNNTHVTEGIIRAVWLITQDKSLNIWCR